MTNPGPSLTVTFQFPGADANVAREAAGTAADVITGAISGAAGGAGASLGATIGNKLGAKMSVPHIALDGVEHPGAWDRPTQVAAGPGPHHVEVYTKLKKGPKTKGRKGKADFTLSDGDSARIHVNFGQYFTTTTISIPGQPDIRSKRFHF
jgi:hypothetical protein